MRQQLTQTDQETTPARPVLVEDVWEQSATNCDALAEHLAVLRESLASLSEAEKQAVVAEAREHLLASARAFEELGDAPDVALRNALAAFGSPQTVGTALSATYQVHGVSQATLFWAAVQRAIAVTVPMNFIAYGAVLLLMWANLNNWLTASWVNTMVVLVLFFILPVFAGRKIGAGRATRYAGLATFLVLALLWPLTLQFVPIFSLVTGSGVLRELCFVMPFLYGLWIPALVWMPIASYTAHLTERLTSRQTRCLPLAR